MNKLKGLTRILLVAVLLVGLLAFTVHAAPVTMYIAGTNIQQSNAGISAAQGATILLYKQVGGRDPLDANAAPNPVGGADTILSLTDPSTGVAINNLTITAGNVINGARQPGPRFIQVDVNPGDTIYARVWSPAQGKGNYYYVTAYSFPSDAAAFNSLTNPTWDWSNLTLIYKADVPPSPSINRAGIVESSVRQGETNNYSISLSVPVVAGAGYQVESATYQTKVWRNDLNDDPDPASPAMPSAAKDVRIQDGTSTSFTFQNNPNLQPPYNAYFIGSKTYHMAVAAYNVFGSTNYSADINPLWTTGGGGGGSFTETWTLGATTTGINTVNMPFNPAKTIIDPTDPNKTPIKTVGDLINSINNQLGGQKTNVTVFGWYDETTQSHFGLTSIVYANGGIDTINSKVTGTLNGKALDVSTLLGLGIAKRPYQVTVGAGLNGKTFQLTGNQ